MKQVLVIFLILFSISTFGQVDKIKVKKEKEDTTVYTISDEVAEYPGGRIALLSFIRQQFMYPTCCMCCTGTVYIKFVITKKGEVTRIEALNNINCSDYFQKEAIRVVKLLSPFKPAKLNGASVNSYYHLPIKFKLG